LNGYKDTKNKAFALLLLDDFYQGFLKIGLCLRFWTGFQDFQVLVLKNWNADLTDRTDWRG